MGGEDDRVMSQERASKGRLILEDVERRACDLAGLDGVHQRRLVDDAAARHVDQPHAVPASSQLFATDQVTRFVGQRDVQRDDVRPVEDRGQWKESDSDPIRNLLGQHRVVRDDLHPERARPGRDFTPHLAQPEDSERLPEQLHTEKLTPFPATRPHRAIGERDLTCQREDQRQGVLRRRDGVFAGSIHHDDSATRGSRDIDIVDARAGAPDDPQPRGRFHHLLRNTGVGADDDPLHVGHGRQEIGRLESRSIDRLQAGLLQHLGAPGRHSIRNQHLHDDRPPRTSSMVRISALIPSTV